MARAKIKIGYAPTRRAIFSAPAAIQFRGLIADRLRELDIDFVDIDDINDEGLLFDDEGMHKIAEKFKKEKVDGLFLPHANFGTEYECGRLAKELGVPVLLWGPRDERPDENGMRLRDSQCGLFATGKVLRRFRIPFTYMNNCNLEDPEFERGIKDFLAVCNVVKVMRNTRILQIGPRPFDFWSTMCNEGELLEKFNIQLAPIPLPELYAEMRKWKEEKTQVAEVIAYCHENMTCNIEEEFLENVAALKVAMKSLAEKYGCNSIAIQCWNALQDEIKIMPCAANALLNEEGIPVICETDIHGAISSLMAEAAAELKDGKFEMNEEQLGQIEAALKAAADKETQLTASHNEAIQAKDQEIQTLKAQIEELNKQPGDSTTHPVNDGKVQESTPMDDFCARLNAAQKLYDLV